MLHPNLNTAFNTQAYLINYYDIVKNVCSSKYSYICMAPSIIILLRKGKDRGRLEGGGGWLEGGGGTWVSVDIKF